MRQYLARNPLLVRVSLVITVAAIALFALYTPASAACTNPADLGCVIVDVGAKAFASLLMVLVQVFNFVLGWVGMFFNWAMMVTVFEFSTYFGNTPGLLLSWTILRDIANIALLFGFVYTGIRMMLDIDKFDVKKTIPTLVIFAALLNFSLFAGEAMIDVSNAVGSTIYAQATSLDCRDAAAAVDCADQGIAGSVLQVSGLASVMQGGEAFQRIITGQDSVAAIGIAFALLIFSVIMIGVLAAGALMLISRAITLMLLLVVSPIGFAGAVIPGLEKFSKSWWTMLTNNVLFAPVFVLLILVGLKIAEGVKSSLIGPNTSLLDALSEPNLNVGSIFVLFAIVAGFMIAALISAQRFSLVGSQQAVNGALNFMWGAGGGHVVGMVGQGALKRYDRFISSVRPEVRGVVGALGGGAADRAIRSALKSTTTYVPRKGMDSYVDSKQKNEARNKELEGIWKSDNDIAEAEANLKKALDKARTGTPDDLEKVVNKMSPKTFKELAQVKKGGKDLELMARAMSPSKFKQIIEDKEGVDDGTKKQMKAARYGELEAQARDAQAGNADARKKVRQWSGDDIITSGLLNKPDAAKNLVHVMSEKQFEGVIGSNELGSTQRQKLRDMRDGTGGSGRFGTRDSAKAAIEGMDTVDIMKIKSSTLVHANVIDHLPPTVLSEISKANKSFTPVERAALKSHVQSVYSRPPGDPARDALNDYLTSVAGTQTETRFRTYYGL